MTASPAPLPPDAVVLWRWKWRDNCGSRWDDWTDDPEAFIDEMGGKVSSKSEYVALPRATLDALSSDRDALRAFAVDAAGFDCDRHSRPYSCANPPPKFSVLGPCLPCRARAALSSLPASPHPASSPAAPACAACNGSGRAAFYTTQVCAICHGTGHGAKEASDA